MSRFIIIDGNAMLHRAYHALPPLTDKEGNQAQAVYGFFSMLLKILEDFSPSYLAVCFDRPKPTFRQQLYVGYQQHRPSLADDFVPQIAKVHEVLEAAKIPIFEVDGYEADDLIGTLGWQAVGKGDDTDVIIVSGDRDLLQLVNSHVKVLAPITGITKMTMYDAQTVKEKFGIKPSQIVDYKALVGDPSDGYPGVGGIGPKTASELLRTYETFENIYQHLGEVPPKLMERLSIDVEQAALAKKLATIVTDVPITLDFALCSCGKLDKNALQEEFENLGFKSLVVRLRGKKVQEEKHSKNIKEEKKMKKESEQLGLLEEA